MAQLEKTITFLLVATFALFLVTVLSASVSPNVYFAEVTALGSRTHLRAGMWGACSLGFGIQSRRAHGCTNSDGAYSLTASIPVAQTQLGQPPSYANLTLLGGHDTGPLVCYLVSFLLVTIAFGTWLYEIFSTKRRSLAIARPVTTGLTVLSCILSWVGFAFAVRLAGALREGIETYNSRSDRSATFNVSRGNAVWIGLVGSILVTFASILIATRWRSLSKDDHQEFRKERKASSDTEAQV